LHAKDFDAIAFPGGFGAAKNLCNWAEKGAKCDVNPDVKRVILDFHSASKPIGAICIAPVLLARVLGDKKVTVTIGDDQDTIAEILKTGAQHEECPVDDYITDRETKVVTTPAYMYGDAKPNEVFAGIFGLAHELVEWA
ncbi:MAG TPA: isoprenoid biosynthesis protein ElbB, partial [Bdellovibrio sp.]